MKQLNFILSAIMLLCSAPTLSAQVNDAEKHIVVVSGQSYLDTIGSQFEPAAAIVTNSRVTPSLVGPKKYSILIQPPLSNPGFVGKAKATIQYTDGFPPKPRYIVYNITYVSSKLECKDDFVEFVSGQSVTCTPLLNDHTTAQSIFLVGIAGAQGGSATVVNGNSISFVPHSDTPKGYVVYAAKDNLGAISNGTITFIKKEDSFAASDTLRFTLLNTQAQSIILPSGDFTVESAPQFGKVSSKHDRVFSYVPSKGLTGSDIFSFADARGNRRVVKISLLGKVQNTSSVRDDQFFTPKNTPITFDVFANDLSSNFPIVSYSQELTKYSLGKFTYTPPSGFSGVKNFSYTVNYGYLQATGKISLYIGNYQPQLDKNYTFNTLKNKSIALTYDVPVDGYTFKILNQPKYGQVEILNNTSISENCNTLDSKATLIYTPDPNYYGKDNFDVEYCVSNNPCVVYKLYMTIHDVVNNNCPCIGADCVWAGDMNGDGRVSVSDILALGRFAGLSGTTRSDLSLPYRNGQHATDWTYTQPNGHNIKHIDANGDGLISVADTAAISQYYDAIHTFVPDEVLSIKDYPFELIPNTTDLDSGDLLILDVVVGSQSKPVVDAFGLAFGLNFSPTMMDSASLTANFY
ncbi:MAG: dockerin type I domain-containing protein, partial [Saprospiraceae bacterium]